MSIFHKYKLFSSFEINEKQKQAIQLHKGEHVFNIIL